MKQLFQAKIRCDGCSEKISLGVVLDESLSASFANILDENEGFYCERCVSLLDRFGLISKVPDGKAEE